MFQHKKDSSSKDVTNQTVINDVVEHILRNAVSGYAFFGEREAQPDGSQDQYEVAGRSEEGAEDVDQGKYSLFQ